MQKHPVIPYLSRTHPRRPRDGLACTIPPSHMCMCRCGRTTWMDDMSPLSCVLTYARFRISQLSWLATLLRSQAARTRRAAPPRHPPLADTTMESSLVCPSSFAHIAHLFSLVDPRDHPSDTSIHGSDALPQRKESLAGLPGSRRSYRSRCRAGAPPILTESSLGP